MPTLYLTLWGIALFGFAFWYAYKKDHGAIPYVLLFLFEIFILYMSYDNDFGNTHHGPDDGIGRGLAYLYLLIMQFILTIAIVVTIVIYQNIKKRKNHQEEVSVSFFQNIHYWIWHYSLKVKIKHPWIVAQIVASILMCLYLAFIVVYLIWIIIMPIYSIRLIIFPIVLIVDLYLYRRAKYCIQRIDDTFVRNENDCILKEKYDAMSKKRILEYKKTFWVYLAGAMIVGAFVAPVLFSEFISLISFVLLSVNW